MKKKAIYSKDLGIDLTSRKESELFKWFLACLLFGKPIQQEVAKKAYLEFVKENLTTPDAILSAGWDKLVQVLDKGHYVRYDYSTADKLLEISEELQKRYGSVTGLIRQSKTVSDLSRRLQEFKGIGPTTARIFIRDIRDIYY
jgi:endonuclease III